MDEKKIKVLIVDDDNIIADMFKDLISSDDDKSVDVCYDGEKAINYIRAKTYDLILADLVMPKVDGLDILRQAKKTNPDSIVIIITGFASLETAIAAIKEGAYDYIRKPCKLEEIKVVVDNAADKIRLNRENRALVKKLQNAYDELMALREKIVENKKMENINFFPSNPSNLHYLFSNSPQTDNYFERLQALASLKENGILNESEFKTFKNHIINMLNPKE